MSLLNRLLETPENETLPGNSEQQEKSLDFFFCFNMKKYFQVEQPQIFERMLSAILLRPPFKQVVKNKPDLYGPFWIATTLIVVIVASASLVTFLASTGDNPVSYQFNKIPVATSLVYGICFGAPYLISIMIRIFGGNVSVVEIICIYGYSLSIFLPITAVCFIQILLLHLVLLGIGFAISSVFLIRGILSMNRTLGDTERMVLGAFILGVQLILVLIHKFYFFNM